MFIQPPLWQKKVFKPSTAQRSSTVPSYRTEYGTVGTVVIHPNTPQTNAVLSVVLSLLSAGSSLSNITVLWLNNTEYRHQWYLRTVYWYNSQTSPLRKPPSRPTPSTNLMCTFHWTLHAARTHTTSMSAQRS